MAEVGILIVDDDAVTQQALKSLLDSEGWRVRIVEDRSRVLSELASGEWSLAIVNVVLADVRGPLFAILKELSQAEAGPEAPKANDASPRKAFRVLFLVPPEAAPQVQPVLERESLPYSIKPYHLRDFLEKVSDLLMEAGAIAQPIRSIGGLKRSVRRRKDVRSPHDAKRGSMFAARDDYQMTEEEMAEFEREEEEERRKRAKALKDQEHL